MRQRKLKGLDEKLRVYSGGVEIDPTAQKGRWSDFFEKDQPIYMELGCGKGQFILSLAKAYPERNFIAVEGNRSVMLRALQKAARAFCEFTPEDLFKADGNEKPFEEVVSRGVFAVKEELIPEAEQDPADDPTKEIISDIENDPAKESIVEDAADSASDEENEEQGCIYAIAPNLIFANMYIVEVTDIFAEDELSGIYLNFSDPWPKPRHAKRRLTHTRYLKGYEKILKPGSALEFKTDNEGLFRFSVEEFDLNELTKEHYTEDLHSSDYESKNFMTEYEEKFSSRGNPIYYCRIRY